MILVSANIQKINVRSIMLIQRIVAIVIVVLMHDFTVLKYFSIVFIIFLNLT